MEPSTAFYHPASAELRFCSHCGHGLSRDIPPDDNRARYLCHHCGSVHYQNPLMVVGTIPVWQNRILLCRRAIEPRYNTWTLPAGFMELDESTAQGALRETREESGARIELGVLFTVIDVPEVNQVHFYFLAEALGPDLDPGPESLEARFYDESEIPWDNMSFQTVSTTLRHFLEDRRKGHFDVHHYALPKH